MRTKEQRNEQKGLPHSSRKDTCRVRNASGHNANPAPILSMSGSHNEIIFPDPDIQGVPGCLSGAGSSLHSASTLGSSLFWPPLQFFVHMPLRSLCGMTEYGLCPQPQPAVSAPGTLLLRKFRMPRHRLCQQLLGLLWLYLPRAVISAERLGHWAQIPTPQSPESTLRISPSSPQGFEQLVKRSEHLISKEL